ncbi:MAG: leucine-rich repeat domain-containing protein, partial [Actinomycetota bacterium]|nr:leucine-rich repeat domain-containing protein [Actinomycetota bacterium]
ITDFAPLAGLTRLTVLSLNYTQITDLAPLAGLTGLTVLWLDNTQITDLAPLAGLSGLTVLSLNDTHITDFAPLAGLSGLTTLLLDGSAALDLRPLRNLRKLADSPSSNGLTFTNSAASCADPRIAEIAEIEDPATRAKTLFDYLETWVPPLPPEAPEPDPLLPVVIEAGRLEIAASLPDATEQAEPLKRALYVRLRAKADDLALAAGNRFPRLARLARVVQADLDKPFEAVDLLDVHLGIEDLAQRAARGEEDGEPFPPEVSASLADVLRIGPGLTLDHADVALYEDRKRRYRAQPEPEENRAAHAALGQAIAAGDPAIGKRLRSVEQRVEGLPDEVVSAVRTALHRNLLLTVGGVLLLGVGAIADSVTISAFVQSNWALLIDAATT